MKTEPELQPSHIEINYGILTAESYTNHLGTTHQYDNIGKPWFTVDMVEVDGFRCCEWSGADYSRAILIAEDCKIGYDVAEVRDLVVAGSE